MSVRGRGSSRPGPLESEGELLVENDSDVDPLLDTTIPPVFATEHVVPKSSIYEVCYSQC